MFLRRRKLLLLLVVLGSVWIIATFFLAHENKAAKSSRRSAPLNNYEEIEEEDEEVMDKRARPAKPKPQSMATTFVPLIQDNQLRKAKLDRAMNQVNRNDRSRKEQFKREEQEMEEEEEEEEEEEYVEEEPKEKSKTGFKMESKAGSKTGSKTKANLQKVWNQNIQNAFPDRVTAAVATEMLALEVEIVTRKTPPVEKKSNQPPGYNGKPVFIDQNDLSTAEQIAYDEGLKKYSHNEFVSKKISLHRPLLDVRDPQCHRISYSGDLPEASIIIAFYNEAWTTLLRTIHSIFDRSPSNLVKEVILVDDFSDQEHLKQQLKDYLALLPKVKLLRTTSRSGVVLARQLGAMEAIGKVLIFLDSHCECTIGWLEPLLNRISDDRKAVLTSVMDIIDDDTFAYKSFDAKSINIGGFDWNLQFTWIGIPDRIKQKRTSDIDPISTATMPGGLFAISYDYFVKLGGFDPGMDMWGAENLEWSFKIWMCGGKLETIPCSHVGHVFRRGTSYKLGNSENPRKNFQRLAEVWMDDFKQHYYQKVGAVQEDNFGDVSARKKLRKKLECQTFDWYLKNVYPEMFIPAEAVITGEIRNKERAFGDGTTFTACLDGASGPSSSEHPVKVWPCHGQGGNQLWMLSKTGEIRRDDSCMDFSGSKVIVYPCHGQKGNQEWEYTKERMVRHRSSNMCMSLTEDSRSLAMSPCSTDKPKQVWYWGRKKMRKEEWKRKEPNNEVLVQDIAAEE